MVREAFRKYCKKSETIDHVKTYKCCRGNYEQIQISRQHRTHCHSECLIEHYIRRCSDYLDKIFKVWDYENKDHFRWYKTDKRDR